MKIKSILFIDIPEVDELAGNPGSNILSLKWKAENLIAGPEYAKHMNGIKYSRGLLTIASFVRQSGITPHYVSINDVCPKELKKQVLAVEAVGITANVTGFFPQVCNIVKTVKKIKKTVLTVVGGYHVTFQDMETLENYPEIDIIVRGEGEIPLSELLKRYPDLDNVKGITYRDKANKIRRNPEALLLLGEKIPLPAYDLLPFPMDKYSIRLQTSRGCPYSCAFCVDPVFWKRLRFIPIPKVLEELEFLRKKLPEITHIHFIDSIFTINPTRTIKLCEEIEKRGFGFQFSADIRANLITQRLIKKMEKAGFTQLLVGFEDPNDEVLKAVKKNLCFQECVDAAKMIKENSQVLTTAYWMVGLPGSNHKTLHRAIEISRKLLRNGTLDLLYSALLVPVPGTPLFQHPSQFGITLLNKDWRKFMRCNFSPVYRLNTLTDQELVNCHLLFETSVLLEYCKKLNLSLDELVSAKAY